MVIEEGRVDRRPAPTLKLTTSSWTPLTNKYLTQILSLFLSSHAFTTHIIHQSWMQALFPNPLIAFRFSPTISSLSESTRISANTMSASSSLVLPSSVSVNKKLVFRTCNSLGFKNGIRGFSLKNLDKSKVSMSAAAVGSQTTVDDALFKDYKPNCAFLFPGQVWFSALIYIGALFYVDYFINFVFWIDLNSIIIVFVWKMLLKLFVLWINELDMLKMWSRNYKLIVSLIDNNELKQAMNRNSFILRVMFYCIGHIFNRQKNLLAWTEKYYKYYFKGGESDLIQVSS